MSGPEWWQHVAAFLTAVALTGAAGAVALRAFGWTDRFMQRLHDTLDTITGLPGQFAVRDARLDDHEHRIGELEGGQR